LLFVRRPGLGWPGAAWVRENWFLNSPSTPNTGESRAGCQQGDPERKSLSGNSDTHYQLCRCDLIPTTFW
jgi:hypothetical protein